MENWDQASLLELMAQAYRKEWGGDPSPRNLGLMLLGFRERGRMDRAIIKERLDEIFDKAIGVEPGEAP